MFLEFESYEVFRHGKFRFLAEATAMTPFQWLAAVLLAALDWYRHQVSHWVPIHIRGHHKCFLFDWLRKLIFCYESRKRGRALYKIGLRICRNSSSHFPFRIEILSVIASEAENSQLLINILLLAGYDKESEL